MFLAVRHARAHPIGWLISRRLAVALGWVLTTTLALAAGPWFARVWQVDEGLPGDSVTGVAQSRDGFLWLGTQAGLARFDGLHFQRQPMPFGRTHRIVRAMFMDRAERLWLAEEAGVIVRFDTASGAVLEWTNNLPRSQPASLAQAGDGAVWVAYLDGSVCRIDGETVRRFTLADGLPGTTPAALTGDGNGRLWLLQAGQLGLHDGVAFTALAGIPDRSSALLAARRGGLFVCAGEQLFHCTTNGVLTLLGEVPAARGQVRPTQMLEEPSGALWIGTMSHGLFRLANGVFAPVETSHGRIKSLAHDREGNIWVGTDGGGLNRLRQQVVELRGKDAGLPFDTVRSSCEDPQGVIWVVTQNGNLATWSAERWRVFGVEDGWEGDDATCVTAGPDGTVFIGTFARGVHRWRAGRFLEPLGRADGLARTSIRGLLPDRDGNLWIAFASGNVLQRHRAGQFTNLQLPEGSRAVRAMTEDAAGRIWLANLDAQLLRVEGDRVVDETALTREPYRPIRCLAGTPDGSLWIGYSAAGVGRLRDGQFTRVAAEQGLLDNSICSLVPDDRGWMWFGADHGLFRVPLADLHAAADGRPEAVRAISHGRDDGLPSLQSYYGYTPGAGRARDGRVLIPTHAGLAIVHPDRVRDNPVPPQVRIERFAVDNRRLNPGAQGRMALAPDHHRIELGFTAPSFIEPERVRFRYNLRGWDDQWIEAGSERQAVYSRLPAGQYEFRVLAANNAGRWSESPATLAFGVRPFFWQTWWFRFLLLLLAAALTVGLFVATRYVSHRRLQAKVRQLEQENAVQRERARIAQDIHDDIGAHMTQISLLAELTRRHLREPDAAGEHVEQIGRKAGEAIKALDEIVWAANPRNDTVADLLDYAGQYAVNFLQAANVRCRLDFPDAPPPRTLSGEARHGLFLAVKEALHNVIKHAHATEVWLRVRATGTGLDWQVDDNGRGFTTPVPDALADGLRNMRERLQRLGGSCDVQTAPGAGVRVTFHLPWQD